MIRSLQLTCLLFVFAIAVEVPAGLKPAKVINSEIEGRKVVPQAVEDHQPPPNVRTPPNLSLRSRMIAAQNSAAAASHDDETTNEEKDAFKQPVVFSKSKAKSAGTAVKKSVIVPANTEIKTPRITEPRPNVPAGNYGVNTGLLTNLVDSQGRIIKGVSSVPIPVPSAEQSRQTKGQASSSVVGNDEDRIVPVKFGRAGDQ